MSSQKVTLQTLIETWRPIADRSDIKSMISELNTFIVQCREEADMKIHEVNKAKGSILNVWVDVDWQTARRNNPTWKEKAWWENRKNVLSRCFHKAILEVYAEDVAKVKQGAMLAGKTNKEVVEEEWLDNVIKMGKLARVAK